MFQIKMMFLFTVPQVCRDRQADTAGWNQARRAGSGGQRLKGCCTGETVTIANTSSINHSHKHIGKY